MPNLDRTTDNANSWGGTRTRDPGIMRDVHPLVEGGSQSEKAAEVRHAALVGREVLGATRSAKVARVLALPTARRVSRVTLTFPASRIPTLAVRRGWMLPDDGPAAA